MNIRSGLAVAAIFMVTACASPTTENQFTGERTVFHNPYAAPELQNGPVGPDQCEQCFGVDGRWLNGLFYPGRGDFAYNRKGERVRLSRNDRRELRRRFQAMEDQIEINRRVDEFNARRVSIPEPVPSAPPVATANSRPIRTEAPATGGSNAPPLNSPEPR